MSYVKKMGGRISEVIKLTLNKKIIIRRDSLTEVPSCENVLEKNLYFSLCRKIPFKKLDDFELSLCTG